MTTYCIYDGLSLLDIMVEHHSKNSVSFNLNAGYDFNGSLENFTARIMRNYNNGVLASKDVEDLIAHEMAHILTFQDCDTFGMFLRLEEEVRESFIRGVSAYADSTYDGAETIAEAFVRYRRGKHLPDDVTFITTQELEDRYPDKTPKERENLITKEYGCVFLMKIGDKLASGEPHDGRAPDYDDWQLNGDILFWHDTLDCALEISSMGIRVDEKSLASQLKKAGCEDRRELPYHKMLLHGELPYTIGGGIGQSRLCMLLLDRAHVGEVQASLWPEEMRQTCREHDIILL